MKTPCLLSTAWVAIFLLGSGYDAWADGLEDVNIALLRGIDTLTAQPGKSDAALRLTLELQAAIAGGEVDRANRIALQMSADGSIPPEVRAIARRLNRELPGLLAARTEAFVAQVDAAVERTRRDCLAAAREADLKPLLLDLSTLRERQPATERSPFVARAVRKLEAALSCVSNWGQYLSAAELGHTDKATSTLHAMMKSTTEPILPLSAFEERLVKPAAPLNADARIARILAKIKTLRDVEVVAPEILSPDFVDDPFGGSGQLDQCRRWFAVYRLATAAFLSGEIGSAWPRVNQEFFNEQNGSWWIGQALRLRGLLLAELIPKYLQAVPGAERGPEETPGDHFQRMITEASAQGRWQDVQRLVTSGITPTALRGKSPTWLLEMTGAVGSFLQAQSREEAGDFTGAILTYEQVLRSPADLAPIIPAVERLKALRLAHPEAAAEAHPRFESDRVLQLLSQIEQTAGLLNERLARFEQVRATATQGARERIATANPPAGVSRGELEELRAKVQQLESALAESNNLKQRLEKLEARPQPAPAAGSTPSPAAATTGLLRLWLGKDFTVHRSSISPEIEKSLAWVVIQDGKQVLSRSAGKERSFRYPQLQPAKYRFYLTLYSQAEPVSNILDFTVSEPDAERLPKRLDNDIDRDGISDQEETGRP